MLLLIRQPAFARPKHSGHLATPGRGSAISYTSELMSVTFPKDVLCSASFIKSRTHTGAVECPGSCSVETLGTLFVAVTRRQGASDRLRSGTGANKFMAKTVHWFFMMINHPRRGARISRDLMARRNIPSHAEYNRQAYHHFHSLVFRSIPREHFKWTVRARSICLPWKIK